MPRFDNDRFYDDAIARYGFGARGVHWRDARSQQTRFDVLLELLPDAAESVSIADAGCGSGALYHYLARQKRRPKRYLGLELKSEFVAAAAQSGCNVRQCDLLEDPLPAADYYLCSGAMNILTRDETRRVITRCFHAAGKGFVFNLLEGDEEESMLYNYWRPGEIEAFCERFEAEVRIVRGYLRGDFTVRLLKRQGTNCQT